MIFLCKKSETCYFFLLITIKPSPQIYENIKQYTFYDIVPQFVSFSHIYRNLLDPRHSGRSTRYSAESQYVICANNLRLVKFFLLAIIQTQTPENKTQ